MSTRPLVLAHRGASHAEPENTVAAFVRARELGADGVELDVRASADGVLIVHHDATAPEVGRFADRPFAEIRAALPDLPTLAEALDACAGLVVNVEVKCLPWEADPDPEHVVARGAVDLVRARPELDVVFSSFSLDTIDAVKSYAPEYATGFLVHRIELPQAIELAREHGHQWVHPIYTAVLEDLPAVGRAHDADLRV